MRWLLALLSLLVAAQSVAAGVGHCAPTAPAAAHGGAHHDDGSRPDDDDEVRAQHPCVGCVAGVRQPVTAPVPSPTAPHRAVPAVPALAGRGAVPEPPPPRS